MGFTVVVEQVNFLANAYVEFPFDLDMFSFLSMHRAKKNHAEIIHRSLHQGIVLLHR